MTTKHATKTAKTTKKKTAPVRALGLLLASMIDDKDPDILEAAEAVTWARGAFSVIGDMFRRFGITDGEVES